MASDGSSSGGSLIGGIIGGVIGFFVGGPAGAVKGFMHGSTIGGLFAPPTGPDQFGPRVESLTITTSTNVATLPRAYGTVAHKGNLIWAKDNEYIEVATTKKVRTGLFSKTKVTTYTYFFTGAFGFCRTEISAVLKIWHAGGRDLVYSATSTDTDTQVASGELTKYITIYKGTADQNIDPLIAEDVGEASCSAYRGVFYIVYDMYPLENYQNNVGNLDPKVEYTTIAVDGSDLDLIVNVPADDDAGQDEWARLHVLTNFDADGANLWRLGFGNSIGQSTSILGNIYKAYPSGELQNLGEMTPPLPGGEASHNRPCAGKSDRNVMCAAAVYINEFAAESEGGGSVHPYLIIPGDGVIINHVGTPIELIGSFEEGLDFYLAGTTDEDTVYRRMFGLDYPAYPGTPMSRQNFGVSESGFVVQWVINSGFADGNGLWTFSFDDPAMAFTGPITEDWYNKSKSFETLMRLWVYDNDRGSVDQFIIGGVSILPDPQTHYSYYKGKIYFVLVHAGIIFLKKITHFTPDGQLQSQSGAYFNVEGMATDGPPATIRLIKIGILNDQLIFVCVEDGVCVLFVLDITVNLSDLESGLTEEVMTKMDGAAVLSEFGNNSSDFYNNISFDFDKMYYCLDGHVYTRKTLLGATTDLGEAPDLILGDTFPAFFNIFGRGNILAVSTYGDDMDKTGVQFFSGGVVTPPGKIPLADIIIAENSLVGITEDDLDVTTIDQMVRGYVVSEIGPVRNVLQQLQAIFPWDVIQSGYKNKYVKRGSGTAFEAAWEDLGAGVSLAQDREMETQLPYRLEITYIDIDLDYMPNVQFAERRTDSKHIVRLNIPLVMTASEAAQAAEILLNIYHIERRTFVFTLPPTYRNLEPSDVITLAMKDVSYIVRLTNIHYLANGTMECQAKQHADTVYISTNPGASGSYVPPTTIPSIANPILGVLDIPVINDIQNKPGYTALVTHTSEGWIGGTMFRARDGVTYEMVQAFSTITVWGTCSTILAAHGCHVVDEGGSLTVKPYKGTIASVTETQFLNEETLLAYGKPGRWEILGFKDATDNLDGTYTLSYLMRGRRGTEQYTGTHQTGDYFGFINNGTSKFVAALATDLDTTLSHKGITTGRDLDSASVVNMTYVGVNLTPLSPVDAFAVRDGDGSMVVHATRRSRLDGGMTLLESISGGGVPIGEASLSLEMDVMDGADVVRTIPATIEQFPYSDTQQIADFGSIQNPVSIKLYQISATVGRGYAGAFTI